MIKTRKGLKNGAFLKSDPKNPIATNDFSRQIKCVQGIENEIRILDLGEV